MCQVNLLLEAEQAWQNTKIGRAFAAADDDDQHIRKAAE
jgi:hypothetical protein